MYILIGRTLTPQLLKCIDHHDFNILRSSQRVFVTFCFNLDLMQMNYSSCFCMWPIQKYRMSLHFFMISFFSFFLLVLLFSNTSTDNSSGYQAREHLGQQVWYCQNLWLWFCSHPGTAWWSLHRLCCYTVVQSTWAPCRGHQIWQVWVFL